ncbi:hypothetical protein NL676_006762 [Syzygium grande]|nr:hypothetical protein NL676_006762 [Syzygium grande]
MICQFLAFRMALLYIIHVTRIKLVLLQRSKLERCSCLFHCISFLFLHYETIAPQSIPRHFEETPLKEDWRQQVCMVVLQEYGVSDVETIEELIEKGSATRKIEVDAVLILPTTTNRQRVEGAETNKSLLAHKECIRALDNDRASYKLFSREKSLSKGYNPKKDALSSATNLKESTSLPLSSFASNASNFEEDIITSLPEQTGEDDYDVSEEFYKSERAQWKRNNGKVESSNRTALEEKLPKSNFDKVEGPAEIG